MKIGKKKKVLVDILIAHKTTYHADNLKKMSVSLILIVGFEINASIDQVKEEVEEEEMTNDFFTTN
jgi:hypothetical protein